MHEMHGKTSHHMLVGETTLPQPGNKQNDWIKSSFFLFLIAFIHTKMSLLKLLEFVKIIRVIMVNIG